MGLPSAFLMPSSRTLGLICSIIFRHRRAYISDHVASSVAFSNTSRMTWMSVRPSCSFSDLFAHAMIWSEIESKRSMVSLLSSDRTLRSTTSGESWSATGPFLTRLPGVQRLAETSSGATGSSDIELAREEPNALPCLEGPASGRSLSRLPPR